MESSFCRNNGIEVQILKCNECNKYFSVSSSLCSLIPPLDLNVPIGFSHHGGSISVAGLF
jgi:hypothetical protein